MGKETATMADA